MSRLPLQVSCRLAASERLHSVRALFYLIHFPIVNAYLVFVVFFFASRSGLSQVAICLFFVFVIRGLVAQRMVKDHKLRIFRQFVNGRHLEGGIGLVDL